MCDLFDQGTKQIRHPFEVVSGFLRRLQKGAIGQKCRASEVVRESNLGDCPCLSSSEAGKAKCGFKEIIVPDQRHLMQDLKVSGCGGSAGR